MKTNQKAIDVGESMTKKGWDVKPLTKSQINAALEVVRANALNESDYELLRKMLGL